MLKFLLFFAFINGAIVGSFLTAWVWRQRHGRSMLEKHSVCPNCGHKLGPIDLIPIFSYIVQGGKCRYCHKRISPQYVLIELTTAILFTLATIYTVQFSVFSFQFSAWNVIALLLTWSIIALLVALFVYDLRWGELPDIWTLGGSVLIVVLTVIAVLLKQPLLWQTQPTTHYSLFTTLLSGIVAALFFYLIVWGSEKILHKPGMGMGDVKLALLMGLFLGYPTIIVAIYLAFISGAVLSLILLAGKQKSWGQSLPFGPFLISGTLLSLWFTPVVISWYQQFML